MPAWVDLDPFVKNDLLLNRKLEQLRLNQEFLRTPPNHLYAHPTNGADYTETSTDTRYVDEVNIDKVLVTYGRPVLLAVGGRVANTGTGNRLGLSWYVDGEKLENTTSGRPTEAIGPDHYFEYIVPLPAGVHDFRLTWRNFVAGTSTMYATSALQFDIQEI